MKSGQISRYFVFLFFSLVTLVAPAYGGGGRYIVMARSQQAQDALAEHAVGHGIALAKILKHQPGVVILGDESTAASLARLVGGWYEEDYVYSLPDIFIHAKSGGTGTVTQPAQSVPWGINKIRALQASTRGAGVKVCISDTGIDLTHPDLQANIVYSVNTIQPSRSAADDNGHGTHVAGIIAAIDNAIGVVGVAPLAKLIAAKGLNKNGSGFSTDLAETIDECRLAGAKVINMSWGSSAASTLIHDAIVRASSAGILMVAAAGNDSSTSVSYPAAFPEVVAVSATDSSDQLAYFSNYGSEIENSAPGLSINSTWKGSTYKTISGTSMASPHVAGVAALMLSAFPSATSSHLLGVDIGLPITQQGIRGRIDAVLSTQ